MKDKDLGLFAIVTNYATPATEDQVDDSVAPPKYNKELLLFSDTSIMNHDSSRYPVVFEALVNDQEYQLNEMK